MEMLFGRYNTRTIVKILWLLVFAFACEWDKGKKEGSQTIGKGTKEKGSVWGRDWKGKPSRCVQYEFELNSSGVFLTWLWPLHRSRQILRCPVVRCRRDRSFWGGEWPVTAEIWTVDSEGCWTPLPVWCSRRRRRRIRGTWAPAAIYCRQTDTPQFIYLCRQRHLSSFVSTTVVEMNWDKFFLHFFRQRTFSNVFIDHVPFLSSVMNNNGNSKVWTKSAEISSSTNDNTSPFTTEFSNTSTHLTLHADADWPVRRSESRPIAHRAGRWVWSTCDGCQ